MARRATQRSDAPILLASRSPRRHELLVAAGYRVELCVPGAEAGPDSSPDPAHPARRALARAERKLRGARRGRATGLLLAADTVVAIGDRCLDKPRDRAQAADFLALLAGATHRVMTAQAFADVALGTMGGEPALCLAEARVAFRELEPAEMAAYLARGEWRGKAGGYAIQGAAAAFATVVAGRLDTVVGLDLGLVEDAHARWLAGLPLRQA